jgi:hypothetical protein
LNSSSIQYFFQVLDNLYYLEKYTIGHFTQLIHDKNTELGCAHAEWTQEGNYGTEKWSKVTCNYFKAAYGNQPVYIASNQTCSACATNCDQEDLIGLCDITTSH